MIKKLSRLHIISNVLMDPGAQVGSDDSNSFDSIFNSYIEKTELDDKLFDLGPYNQKERTNGIAYAFLASSSELVQAMLSWCPACSADKTVLKDYLLLLFGIFAN